MKNCRTLDGLLKAIDNGESCCLKHTKWTKHITDDRKDWKLRDK